MEPYLWFLLGVMLAAGLLGGAINHFLSQDDDPNRFTMLRSLLVGIGASFMVPLFLNMISSNLIDSIKGSATSPGDKSKFFVFAGFCLVAAISSRAFISTLSDRILKEAKEAKSEAREAKASVQEVQSDIEPIVAKQTEQESATESISSSLAEVHVQDDEKKILDVLANSSWTLRSLTGIARDTGMDKAEVAKILEELVRKGLVARKTGEKGPRWFSTELGRSAS
jgi:predicted transcriptional regulator